MLFCAQSDGACPESMSYKESKNCFHLPHLRPKDMSESMSYDELSSALSGAPMS